MKSKRLSSISPSKKKNVLTLAALVVVYALVQIMGMSGMMKASLAGMLVPICVYVVMALSLNLTVGVMGELSLGHAGFMSVGAFCGTATTMILQDVIASQGLRLAVGMLVGALFGALAGFLIGIPTLRLKGDYLAIVTLAFAEIIKSVFGNMYLGLEGGSLRFSMLNNNLNLSEENGRIIIEGAMGIRSVPRIASFTAGFVLIMVCLVLIYNFVASRMGRAVMAVRDNQIAAESVGIMTFKYKIMTFTISAAMAGAAGALFGNNYNSLVANKFGIDTSILVLVFVVLGGQGNMTGSIVAAAALTVLPEALRGFDSYRMLAYAIILIAAMLISNSAATKRFMTQLREKREQASLQKLAKGGAADE